jgi:hypothetical protein
MKQPVEKTKVVREELDIDTDPAMISDPTERHLHILRQRVKRSKKPSRQFRALLRTTSGGKRTENSEIPMQKLTDLTEVIEKVKQELPHTRERMKRSTYMSFLKMKKEYGEIGDQLLKAKQEDDTTGVFDNPHLNLILKKETPTLIDIRANAFLDRIQDGPK